MKCKKCLEEYPNLLESFYKRKEGNMGFYQPCKKCKAIKIEKLTDEQKERRRIRNKIYKRKSRLCNPERTKEQNKKFYLNKILKKFNGQLPLVFVYNNLKKYNSIVGRSSWNKGLKMSQETRLKISSKLKGENSYLWKGGVSSESLKIRSSMEYREWRRQVFERDNWTCVECKIKGGWNKEQKRNVILNADHIKPFATHPELRLDINNGRTLCLDCHKKTATFGIKFYHLMLKQKTN